MVTRFADEKLQSFYEEFTRHSQEEKSYREENDLLLKELLAATRENTEALRNLETKSEGVIQMYNDISAGGRVLEMIGRAGKSILTLLAIAAAIFGLQHFYHK